MYLSQPTWRLDLNGHPHNSDDAFDEDAWWRANINKQPGRNKTDRLIPILERLERLVTLDANKRRTIKVPARTSFERKMIYKFCQATNYSYTKQLVTDLKYTCNWCKKPTSCHWYSQTTTDCVGLCKKSSYTIMRHWQKVEYYQFTLIPPKPLWKKSMVRTPLVNVIPVEVVINHVYPYLPDTN